MITPGHASEPIDPLNFEPTDSGVLAALGYSYQYLGGLRRFNAVPGVAPSFIRAQGFGNLFNRVEPRKTPVLFPWLMLNLLPVILVPISIFSLLMSKGNLYMEFPPVLFLPIYPVPHGWP